VDVVLNHLGSDQQLLLAEGLLGEGAGEEVVKKETLV
jgi:hypothetical protein